MLKTAEQLKLDKNKAKKKKMEFRAYNSKGVDKNRAKSNMEFGRTNKIHRKEIRKGSLLIHWIGSMDAPFRKNRNDIFYFLVVS